MPWLSWLLTSTKLIHVICFINVNVESQENDFIYQMWEEEEKRENENWYATL